MSQRGRSKGWITHVQRISGVEQRSAARHNDPLCSRHPHDTIFKGHWSLLFFTCMFYICSSCPYCRYVELIFMMESCSVLWEDVWARRPDLHWQKPLRLGFYDCGLILRTGERAGILDIILSEGLAALMLFQFYLWHFNPSLMSITVTHLATDTSFMFNSWLSFHYSHIVGLFGKNALKICPDYCSRCRFLKAHTVPSFLVRRNDISQPQIYLCNLSIDDLFLTTVTCGKCTFCTCFTTDSTVMIQHCKLDNKFFLKTSSPVHHRIRRSADHVWMCPF